MAVQQDRGAEPFAGIVERGRDRRMIGPVDRLDPALELVAAALLAAGWLTLRRPPVSSSPASREPLRSH